MDFKSSIVQLESYMDFVRDKVKLEELLSVIGNNIKLLLFVYKELPEITTVKNGKEIRDNYYEIIKVLADLANSYSIYIAAAVLVENEQGNSYHCGLLFNPQGEIILKQRQIYQSEDGINKGKTLNYAEIEGNKIAFMLERDCWHPEIGRVMAIEGVDIVLAVNTLSTVNPWQQLTGVWLQVQQNQFIALEGSIAGVSLVHTPCEISPGRSGILAPVLPPGDRGEILNNPDLYLKELVEEYEEVAGFSLITSELDLDRLREIRKTYPLLNYLNPTFYLSSVTKNRG